MKCKKSLMGLAALLILVFHFYIPITRNPYEMAFYRASYIGVDLFFFLSAYSLGKRDKISYGSFIRNRLSAIYVPFLILTAIAAVYGKWSFKKVLLVISGAELFQKSGGAFLWFIPGIMIIYLIAPFLVSLKRRFGYKALVGMLAAWFALALFLQYVLHYNKLFILINRLPAFTLGLFYSDIRRIIKNKWSILLIVPLLVAGLWLVYSYGAVKKINVPIQEMYYYAALPLVAAIVMLSDYISERISIRNIPMAFLGGITLELYGLQMIFGYDLEQFFVKKTRIGYISFLLTAISLIALAFIFSTCRKGVKVLLKKFKENRNL